MKLKSLILTGMAFMMASSVWAAKQYDYVPDDGMATFTHDKKALLRDVPFIRDTMKVRFDNQKHLVIVLPGTLAASDDSIANGRRYVRYEYPELYYPKDASTSPQVYLDVQKAPYVSPDPKTAPLEKVFEEKTVDLGGNPYLVRMASSSQYPKTQKDYFPLVVDAATASLDNFDPSKTYYTQDRIPWNMMEAIQGSWGSSTYKTVLTVKDYKINGNPVEAIYNVSDQDGKLSMSIITVNGEAVHRYHLVLTEEESSVMTKEKVLYVDGVRTSQAKDFGFAMGVDR